MKKLVLLTSFICGTLVAAKAQLQNLDFENWTNHTESEPNLWKTPNVYTPQPLLFCTKVTGAPGFAPHIETLSFGGLAIPGFISNSFGDYMAGEGGVLYTGATIPTKVKGQYRYNIQANDSAMLYIILKSSGTILTRDSFYMKGSLPAFTAFSFNLSPMAVMPDSVIITATSGAFNFSPGAPVGSWLELDNIALGDAVATYSIVNADFDTWNTSSVDVPDVWGKNGIVNKTTDKYSGSYAAKLISGTPMGMATAEAGQVYTTLTMAAATDSLTGYYKYIPASSDQANVQMVLNDATHSQMLSLNATLPPAANYTYFSIPLSNTINATEVSPTFSSSKIPPVDGSILFIDNIAIKHKTNSVKEVAATSFKVYPNPANDVLHIAVKDADAKVNITITDTKGSIIQQQESTGKNLIDIPVSKLAAGLYFYELQQGSTITKNKFLKQ